MLYNIFIMLNKNINMLNKYWNYVDFRHYNKDYVPNSSGIYLFARVMKRILQVPVGLDILYVGKSKNLRKRFKTYSNSRKLHNNLLESFIKTEPNLEFWFLETENNEITVFETLITKELKKYNKNLTNKITFKSIKGELYV